MKFNTKYKYIAAFSILILSVIYDLLSYLISVDIIKNINLIKLNNFELVLDFFVLISVIFVLIPNLNKFIKFSKIDFAKVSDKQLRAEMENIFFKGRIPSKIPRDPIKYSFYIIVSYIDKLKNITENIDNLKIYIEEIENTSMTDDDIDKQNNLYNEILTKYDTIVNSLVKEVELLGKMNIEIKESFKILSSTQEIFKEIDFMTVNISSVFFQMSQIVNSINELNQNVEKEKVNIDKAIKENMKNLSGVLEKVSNVSKVMNQMEEFFTLIQDVNEKIEILGINAAIEASKVTDKKAAGFKVIAENIRNLSDESKRGLEKIKQNFSSIERELKSFIIESKGSKHYIEKIDNAIEKLFGRFTEIGKALNSESEALDGIVTFTEELQKTIEKAKDDTNKLVEFNNMVKERVLKDEQIMTDTMNKIFELSTNFTNTFENWQKLFESLKVILKIKNELIKIIEHFASIEERRKQFIIPIKNRSIK